VYNNRNILQEGKVLASLPCKRCSLVSYIASLPSLKAGSLFFNQHFLCLIRKINYNLSPVGFRFEIAAAMQTLEVNFSR